ncbi:MAG TPA: hypothetical protein VN914_08235, partial [Polyangia bacterium]|nr:hypothetical protein [Polyangia bacterium]
MKRAVLLTAVLGGCYTSGELPAQALRDLAGLTGPRLVKGERLEPGTRIRAQLTDGSRTGWFEAGEVRVSVEGLMLGDPPDVPPPGYVPGLRWNQVQSFELRSLDPTWSFLTVPLFPLVMMAGALAPDELDRATSPTDGEGEGSLPPQLWSPAPQRALFTPEARRRALVQGLVTADLQGSYRGDASGGVSAGLRFRHLYELAAVVRPLSVAGVDLDGGRRNALALGASFGLHVDGDCDPRFAFYLGAEVVGSSG